MTKNQTKLLKWLGKGNCVDTRNLTGEIIKACEYFSDKGLVILIQPEPNDEGWAPCIYVISESGKSFLADIKAANKKATSDWIRYIITTLIAVAAFLKSFFFDK